MIRVESEAMVELEGGTTKEAWQLRKGDLLAGGGVVLSDAVVTHVELERIFFADDDFHLRVPPDQGVTQGHRKRIGRRLSVGSCSTLTTDRPSLTVVDKKGNKRAITFVTTSDS